MSKEKNAESAAKVILCLKPYLDRLRSEEGYKPLHQRREVPSLSELADEAEIHPVTMSSIANNKIKRLNLDVLCAIISLLRKRGFEADVKDLLLYIDNNI